MTSPIKPPDARTLLIVLGYVVVCLGFVALLYIVTPPADRPELWSRLTLLGGIVFSNIPAVLGWLSSRRVESQVAPPLDNNEPSMIK